MILLSFGSVDAEPVSGEIVAIVAILLYFLYAVVTKGIEVDRDNKRNKLEAELKMKLAENFQDPEVIERIANLQVLQAPVKGPAKGSVKVNVEMDIAQEHQKLALERARRRAQSTEPRIGKYVLPGLICLLLGIGFFIAYSASSEAAGLIIPACVLGAVGLSLLSYAVFLQDMAKKAYEREQPVVNSR